MKARNGTRKKGPDGLFLSRLMQVAVDSARPHTTGVHPQIRITRSSQIPRSPFVIDLSLPQPKTQICTHPQTSLVHDLFVSRDEVFCQLEQEEHALPTNEAVLPLIHAPAHDLLWQEIEAGAEELFETLEMPEDEPLTAEQEDVLFTLDDLIQKTDTETPAAKGRRFMHLHPAWKRSVVSFVSLSFLFVLPISAMKHLEQVTATRDEVAAASNAALSDLRLGAAAFAQSDYGIAAADFARAKEDFVSAKETIDALSVSAVTLANAIPQSHRTLTTAEALIASGMQLSEAGSLLSEALNALRENAQLSLTGKLDILSEYLVRMESNIDLASEALTRVSPEEVPEELRAQLEELKGTVPAVNAGLSELMQFYDGLGILLGANEPMRYLLLFQNNTEVRPTGGFIGSYAEVTLRDGEIDELIIPGGGSYDLQGALGAFVAAPEPLQLLNARWEFQDSNWFPDFAESAKKLLWFYDHAGGPTVDGVIAINATSVAELLSITGAIDMPNYGRTMDSENFLFETQKIVEIEYDKEENRPKAFLADFVPQVLSRVLSQDTLSLLSVLKHVQTSFTTKEAQVYLRDPQMMRLVDALGWSGRVETAPKDYLMVVDANLGGGKTDLVIEEQVDLTVDVLEDGTIQNTVTITREHEGLTGALFTGVNNVDYLRVYVPYGSTLVSAQGDFAPPAQDLFEPVPSSFVEDDTLALVTGETQIDPASGTRVNHEFGKTVFGNWMQTKPGSRSQMSFTYQLPFHLDRLAQNRSLLARVKMAVGLADTDAYSLFVQKQSGVLNRATHVRMNLPTGLSPVWATDDALFSTEGVTFENVTDAYLGTLLE